MKDPVVKVRPTHHVQGACSRANGRCGPGHQNLGRSAPGSKPPVSLDQAPISTRHGFSRARVLYDVILRLLFGLGVRKATAGWQRRLKNTEPHLRRNSGGTIAPSRSRAFSSVRRASIEPLRVSTMYTHEDSPHG
jgi:hypothetical protein